MRRQRKTAGRLPEVPARAALVLALLLAAPALADETAEQAPDRWVGAMQKFAEQDAERKPPVGGVVFVGSSSIRKWKLGESFPKIKPTPLNRGFGGSEISDSIRHFDLLVRKHKPRLVVLYAGDNDLAHGKSAAEVHEDFRRFAELLRQELPETRLAFIAIKPSLARWKLAPAMRGANAAIQKTCEADSKLSFLDVWTPMLGEDGRPRPELFVEDGLHLSDKGYALWAGIVRKEVAPRAAENIASAKD